MAKKQPVSEPLVERRCTLRLPESDVEALMTMSAVWGRSVSDVVSGIAHEWLQRPVKRRVRRPRQR